MRIALLALSLFIAACGPIGMIPGGALRGSLAASEVADWAALDHCKIIKLETGAEDPYSINIWAAGSGPTLYLAAGRGAESKWVRNIQSNPAVRVQACDQVYRMRAAHTTVEEDLEAFLAAVSRKYDWKREQALEYRAWVFRLDPA